MSADETRAPGPANPITRAERRRLVEKAERLAVKVSDGKATLLEVYELAEVVQALAEGGGL